MFDLPPLRHISTLRAKPSFGPADDVRRVTLSPVRPSAGGDVPPNGAPGGCSPWGLLRCGSGPGVAEGRDHLLGEAVEVCELNLERGAEGGRANEAVEAGVALLDRLQLLDDVLRPAGEEAAGLHRILDRRQFDGA